MKLNVGLIGLGRLGRVYARDLSARVTGVRLAALADTNAKLAEEVAGELDVPRWYSDPLAMLDDTGIDAAIIVSPTDTHTDLAVAALDRKKSVFCEKPPALSLSQTQKMKDARGAHAWLPANGIYAPLRCRLRRREEKSGGRRDRKTDRVQIFVARSLPAVFGIR